MGGLLERLIDAGAADDVVLVGADRSVTRAGLVSEVERLAAKLSDRGVHSVALYADNGIDWVVVDLACQQAGIRITPLPLFFSEGQVAHAIVACGADALVSDVQRNAIQKAGVSGLSFAEALTEHTALYRLGSRQNRPPLLPEGTQKITFTSGTTGTPKGVCLSAAQQMAVAVAIAIAASVDLNLPRHLCVLPLSTLLENLAGVYAPLLAGGTVIVPALARLGLTGSSQLNISTLLAGISEHQPGSLILVPEMLNLLTVAAGNGWQCPSSLHFIAVGGGKVAPDLLRRARAAGLPAYEGYGLSECTSVVCLNVPGDDRPGCVGKPLSHVRLRIEKGEIVVSDNVFLGYAGAPDSWHPREVHTGDIGHVDSDGFVHIEGRARNRIISSYGRNLSPEWVESELLAGAVLRQAVVFGDARPFCVAGVYPADPSVCDSDIAGWIKTCNQRLPDYARVLDWFRLPQPLGSATNTATANGRPKRGEIFRRYQTEIDAMYTSLTEVSSQ